MYNEVTFAWSSRSRLEQKSLNKIAGTIHLHDRLQEKTEVFRSMLGQPSMNNERHSFVAQHLPVVSVPYICERQFAEDCVQGLTFFGVLNIFGLEDEEQVEQVRSTVNRDSYTFLSFVGLSGYSVQVFFRYRFVTEGTLIPLSNAPSEDYALLYQHVYAAVLEYYRKGIGTGDFAENGHTVSCTTILAHDPDCMLNPEATYFSLVWDGKQASIVETTSGSKNIRSKNFVYCRDCGRKKLLFATEEKAVNFMKFNNDAILSARSHAPVRPYFCVACGGYHLTSIENSENCEKAGLTEQIIDAYEQSKLSGKKGSGMEADKKDSKVIEIRERITKSQEEKRYYSASSQIFHLLDLVEEEGDESQIPELLELHLDNHRQWLNYLLDQAAGEPNLAEIEYNQLNAFFGYINSLRRLFEKYTYCDTELNKLEVQAEPIRGSLEVVRARVGRENAILSHINSLKLLIVRITNSLSVNWLSDAELLLQNARIKAEELYTIDPQNEFLPNALDQLIALGKQLEEKVE